MNIVFLNNFPLPNKSANAVRVIEFIKLCRLNGHNTNQVGIDYHSLNDEIDIYKDISYKNIGTNTSINKRYLNSFIRKIITCKKIKKELLELNNKKQIDVVFVSGFIWDYHKILLKLSRKLSFKLVVNMVEWHSETSFPGFFGKIKYKQNLIGIQKVVPKMKNIICISSLLDEYYKQKGCHTVRIPTILDIDEYDELDLSSLEDKILIGYAGNPGKKDNIVNFVKAISMLEDVEKEKIHFNLYGIDTNQLINLGVSNQLLESLRNQITIHGKIDQQKVKTELSKLNYTILFRPDKKSSHAGFPTKVPESLASGVPVILNITSDLGEYIIDNQNGIICDDDSLESNLIALKRVLKISVNDMDSMRYMSRKSAKDNFDYRNYKKTLETFFEKLN